MTNQKTVSEKLEQGLRDLVLTLTELVESTDCFGVPAARLHSELIKNNLSSDTAFDVLSLMIVEMGVAMVDGVLYSTGSRQV